MENKLKGKIFNAQEVQALIAGNKTQFREVIKNQPCIELGSGTIERSPISDSIFYWKGSKNYSMFSFGKCPYKVGQKIFCKESFDPMFYEASSKNDEIAYKADLKQKNHYIGGWKPAQHMKQEHSRLTLLIKEIKVERLAEISREDCLLEGVESYYTEGAFHTGLIDEIEAFEDIWNATHKEPEEKFEANPWVWKVEMEVVK